MTVSRAMTAALTLAFFGAVGGASAQDAGTASPASPVPNSDTNYLDDKLRWAVPEKTPEGRDPAKVYCLPPKTKLIGRSPSFIAPAASDAAPQEKTFLPVVLDAKGAAAACPGAVDPPPLAEGTQAYVSADDVENMGVRSGWDFGALLVPFKYQLGGRDAVRGSATLGLYAGYRLPWRAAGIAFRPIAFAGVGEVPQSSHGLSQTVAGFSYGAGVVTTVGGAFNVGVVIGADHAGLATSNPDRPWIALELGYSFTP